jgi:16S rRNA (cytidine1402-2'-O)-methyltransferase
MSWADGRWGGLRADAVGRLLVVATPIGNLEDITYRAVRALASAPLVLAEDTRHTRKLLTHYGISARLRSYHQHNKTSRLSGALEALAVGDVALVSSAGMPSVSDPGYELVRAAVDAGYDVDVLPGPSAVVTAIVGAALPAPGFLFAGFLPRTRGSRRARLAELATIDASIVLYESPHRVRATLADALDVLGDRPAVAARELTKVHQEYVRGSLATLQTHFTAVAPLGEFTLVIGPGSTPEPVDVGEDRAREVLTRLRAEGADRRTALAVLSSELGVGRNRAYALWLGARDTPSGGS